MTTTQHGTTWCPTCRKSQPIMDVYRTDTGDERNTFQELVATPLECGHPADTGTGRPAVDPRFTPDPTLVDRVRALQVSAGVAR